MMPGLAGLVTLSWSGDHDQILEKMLAVMNRQAQETRLWSSPQVGLGGVGHQVCDHFALHLPEQRQGAVQEACALAYVGYIEPDERLAKMADPCMANRLLTLYRQAGIEAMLELNGSFLLAIWDGPERRLTLLTDRFGRQPAYYWIGGPGLVFATEMKAIAAHPRFVKSIDRYAVYDLLAAEQMLGECTLYEGVQALPPASMLIYQDGGADLRTYWQPVFYQPGQPAPSEDEALDGLSDHVCQAVESELASIGDQRLNLLLTGGLDSRLLAGALARCAGEGRILSSTIGHENARDVRFGREVAQAAGFPYAMVPVDPAYVANFGEECVRRTEGNMSVHAAWILGQRAFLQQNGLSAVMTGVGGESISGRIWISEQNTNDPHQALDRMADGYWRFQAAARLMRPHLAADAEHSSRALMRRLLVSAPAEDQHSRYDYFYYRLFYRRPSGSILSEDARVLEPLLNARLVDYALRLPPKMRQGGRLYNRMILSCFPQVAQAGYSDTDRPLVDSRPGVRAGMGRFARQLYRRATRRARHHLPFLQNTFASDDPGSAIYYNTWLRGPSRPYVQRLMAESADRFSPWLDMRQVRRLVDDHMAGRRDVYNLLSGLVTLAIWLRQYE